MKVTEKAILYFGSYMNFFAVVISVFDGRFDKAAFFRLGF